MRKITQIKQIIRIENMIDFFAFYVLEVVVGQIPRGDLSISVAKSSPTPPLEFMEWVELAKP